MAITFARLAAVTTAVLCILGAVHAQKPRLPKPAAARVIVEAVYDETYQGTLPDATINSTLKVKVNAGRWFKQTTNEVGNAEWNELEGAPVPAGSGDVSFNGTFKGSSSSGTIDAMRSVAGALTTDDVRILTPAWSDTGDGLKVGVIITPKLKGRCFLRSVTNGETTTSTDCANGVVGGPTSINYEEIPGATKGSEQTHTANFEMTLVVEPKLGSTGAVTGSSGVDDAMRARRELEAAMQQAAGANAAWRGAVTTGNKLAGFKVTYAGKTEQVSDDKAGKITRTLTMTVTIIPGLPTK